MNNKINRIKLVQAMQPPAKREPRYKQVINAYDECRSRIMVMTGMEEQGYFQNEYETGLNLLEEYFKDLPRNAVQKYIDVLLQSQQLGFWPWLKAARRRAEWVWLNSYRFRYEVEVGVYGHAVAGMNMLQQWHNMHDRFCRDTDMHNMLSHWLRNNTKFRI